MCICVCVQFYHYVCKIMCVFALHVCVCEPVYWEFSMDVLVSAHHGFSNVSAYNDIYLMLIAFH